jgi:hypothetical protein
MFGIAKKRCRLAPRRLSLDRSSGDILFDLARRSLPSSVVSEIRRLSCGSFSITWRKKSSRRLFCIGSLRFKRATPSFWFSQIQNSDRRLSAMPRQQKFIYFFGGGKAEGNAKMRDILGGKGAGLHEMTRIGVPVPPGFTITTDVCTYYYAHRRQYPKGLESEVRGALTRVEKILDRGFGDSERPLLVSVRSGARESMPGMMDTVLNLA